MTKTALFIPCYNEEKRLDIPAFERFIEAELNSIDFFFVNDGSIDNTSKLLQQKLLNYENVSLIENVRNIGKGPALRNAILNSDLEDYEYFGFIDADSDIPLNQIRFLRNEIEAGDYLIAISKRDLLKNLKKLSVRNFGSVFIVKIANKLIKLQPGLSDTQCGCKLFKREIYRLCFKDPFISKWLFDIEIFLRLRSGIPYLRNRIVEVPVLGYSKSNFSNFKFSQNLRILKQLYFIYKTYK
ncbi:glycosyltransferase [Gramella sp. KN1008]|uniref:glycosyltransferase n=1 Tax=Gramella sp. KN1008 TaxID=2529298 RepID=UPI00103D5A5E|nr:glycosyltransferase [Gramella sp. KN1008]TBW26467.1 glycosyltransferase [Gramella sp. KN1008]